jgi:hypothetical protein
VLHHSGARTVFVADAEQLRRCRLLRRTCRSLSSCERGPRTAQAELEERVARSDAGGRVLDALHVGDDRAARRRASRPAATSVRLFLQTPELVREDDCVSLFLPLAHALALICSIPSARRRRHARLLGEGRPKDRRQPDGAQAELPPVGSQDLREDPHASHQRRRRLSGYARKYRMNSWHLPLRSDARRDSRLAVIDRIGGCALRAERIRGPHRGRRASVRANQEGPSMAEEFAGGRT